MSAEEVEVIESTSKARIVASRSVVAERKASKQTQRDMRSTGLSQQIPLKVIQRAAHESIELPLGSRSFEDLIALLIENTDHAACVEQTALDVAGRGWSLVANKDDDEIISEEEDIALQLLEVPNDEDSLSDVMKKAIVDYCTIGNAWIEVVRPDPESPPTQLVHAPGIAMRIRSNLRGYVMLSLETNRWAFFRKLFSDPTVPESMDPRTGNVLNEMIFWKRYHPGSLYYGVPRIVPAMRAIKGSLYADERNIRFFINRAMPEWTVIVEGETDNINDKELNALLDDLEEHWKNVLKGDDYRTWIGYAPAGIKIRMEKISIDIADASHTQYKKDNRDEVVRANGMMPNRIGIIETGNIGSGTGESQIEIYKSSAIHPLQRMTERTINMILQADRPIGLGLRSLKFEWDEIDATDELREAQIAQLLASTGWPTVNDGRNYISRFSKMEFEEIDEPWADLPLPIVTPQLAGVIETPAPEQEIPGARPAFSGAGTPLPSVPPGSSIAAASSTARRKSPVAIDRAYLHLKNNGLGRNRRDGS